MRRPVELRAATVIDRPAATVWSIVSDYRLDPRWRRGVETMDPDPNGPIVPTTTTREVLHFGGRTYRSEGVIVALEPGRSITWRTVSGTTASELTDARARLATPERPVPQ